MLAISQASTSTQIAAVRELIREYTAWVFTLTENSAKAPTFEGLEEELATLPGVYSPPAGHLFLAMQDGEPAGCVALKRHDANTSELKRLYVRPTFRGLGIGWHLAKAVVAAARQSGYKRIVLDSHISMRSAHQIYTALGFKVVATPDDFPASLKPVVVFMECDLTKEKT